MVVDDSDQIRQRTQLLIVATVTSVVLTVLALAGPVGAHDPDNESPSRRWTCVREPSQNESNNTDCDSGTDFIHHTNADARWRRTGGWPSGETDWINDTNTAAARWEGGHRFNYVYDGSGNVITLYPVPGNPCGGSNWLGCTVTGWSGDHLTESLQSIEVRQNLTGGQRLDLMVHEFGHVLGLGHSSQSDATMWATIHAGADTLLNDDTRGRSQIYGHEHGWWS